MRSSTNARTITMPQSKTTIVRQRKVEGLCEALGNLVFFVSHYQKRNLRVIRHSELKKVLEITASWKTELLDYQKIAQNSSTASDDGHGAAETKEGIEK